MGLGCQLLLYCLLLSYFLKISWSKQPNFSSKQDFMTALTKATTITTDLLKNMYEKWQISKFPNFLQSAAMTHTSWEVLKLKYQQKLLQQALSNEEESMKMIISFMGSSVTAGHDSPFNQSFPILTQELMAPAFKPMKMTLTTRNAAMGNNPCMPCKSP